MHLALTKYEALSHRNKNLNKKHNSKSKHCTTLASDDRRGSTMYPSALYKELKNSSFLSEGLMDPPMSDWRRQSDSGFKLGSVSVVEYKRNARVLATEASVSDKRNDGSGDSRQFWCERRLGRLSKNNSLKGNRAREVRKAKQVFQLKNRIVNLPNNSFNDSSSCLTEIIERITDRGSGIPKRIHNSKKKSLNFRLKLKKPDILKELVKQKIQMSNSLYQFDPSAKKNAPEPVSKIGQQIQLSLRPYSHTSPKRRYTYRSKVSKIQQLAENDHMFNIEPWNIEL